DYTTDQLSPQKNLIVGADGGDGFGGSRKSELLMPGTGATTVYGSLGNDEIFGNQASSSTATVRYQNDEHADQYAALNVAMIDQVNLTVEAGNSGFGNMTADVFSNTGDPVSHQTLANVQRVVLTGAADTVNVTTTPLQSGSANPTIPLPNS